MVLSSSFQKCSHRLSLSPSIKKINVDKFANGSVRTEVDNKKRVLHNFRQSFTPFSTETNIVKSSVVNQVTTGDRASRRREIQIPRIIVTPTVNRTDDESLPFVNHRHPFQNNIKLRSGSCRVNRNDGERGFPSTSSLLGPSSCKVHGQGIRIKADSAGRGRGNRFLRTPQKQTPKRAFLSPGRYICKPKTPPKTKHSEERNPESGTALDIKSTQRSGSRWCGTCSATHYTNGNFTRNAVSCSDLNDIQSKDAHRSHNVDNIKDSCVETVYAIFAHESGKQSYTKFVRICDSVETCFSDYLEKERIHNDSFEGFQDVDLSIDPSCLSFSDDEF